MNTLYDQQFKEMTLAILKDNIDDLLTWSSYNNDKELLEIDQLRQKVEIVERKLNL